MFLGIGIRDPSLLEEVPTRCSTWMAGCLDQAILLVWSCFSSDQSIICQCVTVTGK